ncbi:hypothetical protein LCGC14_3006870 [marine sediment metagenome]|uniref:Uncharacterized protein n=1 Tax=marine sediment metagenome TaxID=412755 RepID=A0A0F8WZ77_9ZZZZ
MDKAKELLRKLVDEFGEKGPVDQNEGFFYCLLCGGDLSWLPTSGHAQSCLWLEILSNASEEDTKE